MFTAVVAYTGSHGPAVVMSSPLCVLTDVGTVTLLARSSTSQAHGIQMETSAPELSARDDHVTSSRKGAFVYEHAHNNATLPLYSSPLHQYFSGYITRAM